MARLKKKSEPEQIDLEEAIEAAVVDAKVNGEPAIDPSMTADLLIKRELELDDYINAQDKAFKEFCKPYRAEIEAIRNRLLAMHLEQKTDQFKTDYGISYISEIMEQKVSIYSRAYSEADGTAHTGREALLYYMLDNWEQYGNDALKVSIDVKTVRRHMDEHGGDPPPGIKVDFFKRVNIRRS